MEIVDLEGKLERELENEIRERQELGRDTHDRLEGWVASTDRRTDKLWTEWHNLNDRVKQLDKTINPNMDSIKGLTK